MQEHFVKQLTYVPDHGAAAASSTTRKDIHALAADLPGFSWQLHHVPLSSPILSAILRPRKS